MFDIAGDCNLNVEDHDKRKKYRIFLTYCVKKI